MLQKISEDGLDFDVGALLHVAEQGGGYFGAFVGGGLAEHVDDGF